MRYRQWWSALLLVGFVAALIGLQAVTGGRLYAAGVPSTRLATALQLAAHPTVADAEPGAQLAKDNASFDKHRGRRQRGREAPPLQLRVIPAKAAASTRPTLTHWQVDAAPATAPPPPPTREPCRPRAP